MKFKVYRKGEVVGTVNVEKIKGMEWETAPGLQNGDILEDESSGDRFRISNYNPPPYLRPSMKLNPEE